MPHLWWLFALLKLALLFEQDGKMVKGEDALEHNSLVHMDWTYVSNK